MEPIRSLGGLGFGFPEVLWRDATGAPDSGAGIPTERVTTPLALSIQESWRQSDKSRERWGSALAMKEPFPYDTGPVQAESTCLK